ncbi:MAG: hypothetical protein L6V91_06490 [Bacilli bacterium]|nr:MAG: hypothetical protein L6V91_06490 [Bacilli bacterium]
MEIIISVINYLTIRKYKTVFTERVGKHKTTLLMLTLILGVLTIKINNLKIYVYIIFIINYIFSYTNNNCLY